MAQLWGGRFTKATDEKVFAFNASILFDQKLFEQDIEGSIAHATMLAKQGILTKEEKEAILGGLESIREDVRSGKLPIDEKQEDIHSFVEANLIDRDRGCRRSCIPEEAGMIRWPWICGCIRESR